MADPREQQADKSKQAKKDAAASNSVPELRDAVDLIIDDLIALKEEVRKLRELRGSQASSAL